MKKFILFVSFVVSHVCFADMIVIPPTLNPDGVISVSANANDSSGRRGGNPFKTITAAKNVAQAGDTIIIYPGVYVENNLLKKGVNYYYMPGAVSYWIETNASGTGGWGIFDDRTVGDTTNIIGGYGTFYHSCGTNHVDDPEGYGANTNSLGFFVTVNPNTRINFHCDSVSFGSIGNVDESAFAILNCAEVRIEGNDFYDAYPNGVTVAGHGLQPTTAQGTLWIYGDEYFKWKHIHKFSSSIIWGVEHFTIDGSSGGPNPLLPPYSQTNIPNAKFSFWGDIEHEEGINYMLCVSTNMRSWWNIGWDECTGQGECFEMDTAGKHYINALKLSAQLAPVMQMSGAGNPSTNNADNQVWLTAQKVTASGQGAQWFRLFAGTLYANVQEYEDDGILGTSTTGGINLDNSIGTNGLYYINGGVMKTFGTNIPIYMGRSSAQLFLNNLRIDTTANAGGQAPIYMAQKGAVTLKNCDLLSSTFSVFSPNAGTIITNMGYTFTNNPVNANITWTSVGTH